jgi:hypothetical protein
MKGMFGTLATFLDLVLLEDANLDTGGEPGLVWHRFSGLQLLASRRYSALFTYRAEATQSLSKQDLEQV